MNVRTITKASMTLVLALAMVSAAQAAPIVLSDDVDLGWGNGRFVLSQVAVNGAPRLVPDSADLGTILFQIDGLFAEQIESFSLIVNVADALEEIVETSPGVALQLLFTSNSVEDFLADPLFSGGIFLNAFTNFNLLPLGDLILTVGGQFLGNSSWGNNAVHPDNGLPCAVDNLCPDSGIRLSINVSGPGTAYPPTQPVPEPGTLILLLTGVVGGGIRPGWRRLSRRLSANRPIR